MKVTLTEDDIKKAVEKYSNISKGDEETGGVDFTLRGSWCPLANALRRCRFNRPYVGYTHASYIEEPVGEERSYLLVEHPLTKQAQHFAEEFDVWFEKNYMEGSLGSFVGRTIEVWDESVSRKEMYSLLHYG